MTLKEAGLDEQIYAALDQANVADVAQLAGVAARIREQARAAPLPREVANEVLEAYRALSAEYGEEQRSWHARSTWTASTVARPGPASQLTTPRKFNPRGEAWLPILHTERGARKYIQA